MMMMMMIDDHDHDRDDHDDQQQLPRLFLKGKFPFVKLMVRTRQEV